MKEVRAYLVRHAKPVMPDHRRRFLGQSDPGLSPRGLEQTRLLADHLQPISFGAAHSSDLRRCKETAEIIVEGSGIPVQEHEWLREIDTGLWEGLTIEEAVRLYPTEHAQREQDPASYPFPGGESFRDVQARAVPSFLRLLDEGPGSILIVAHRGVNRVLLAHLLELPLEQLFSINQDYCCTNLIRVIGLPNGDHRYEVTMLRGGWDK